MTDTDSTLDDVVAGFGQMSDAQLGAIQTRMRSRDQDHAVMDRHLLLMEVLRMRKCTPTLQQFAEATPEGRAYYEQLREQLRDHESRHRETVHGRLEVALAERDRARAIAVALEQELAALTEATRAVLAVPSEATYDDLARAADASRDYRRARGAVGGTEPAEDVIRRIRDAD